MSENSHYLLECLDGVCYPKRSAYRRHYKAHKWLSEKWPGGLCIQRVYSFEKGMKILNITPIGFREDGRLLLRGTWAQW